MSVKMGKHSFQYINRHLLPLIALRINYLPELTDYVVIRSLNRIFQKVVYGNTNPVGKSDEGIERKAALAPLDLPHVGIRNIYSLR